MKNIIPFLILSIISKSSFSQNSNDYIIEKTIKITYIHLEINSSIIYTRGHQKTLKGIRLNRYNDSLSYLWKQYDKTDTIGDSRRTFHELFMKNAIPIPTTTFDRMASQLQYIDIETVNNSTGFNIMDGSWYTLKFSGEGYEISLNAHTANAKTKERGLEDFLNVCQDIWDLRKLE